MRYRAIIFDLDGTLLDTLDDLANSMNTVLYGLGFPVHEKEKYKYFVGNGIVNLARVALPENHRTDEEIKNCVERMNTEYDRHWADNTHPYSGINELLDGLVLKNIRMAVLSNKPDEFTGVIIKKYFSRWKFDVVFGARPLVPVKPNPAGALEIAGLLEISPSEFLYLGDTNTDMKTANAAGMYAVGAAWGFREERELLDSGAKAVIHNPRELLNLL